MLPPLTPAGPTGGFPIKVGTGIFSFLISNPFGLNAFTKSFRSLTWSSFSKICGSIYEKRK